MRTVSRSLPQLHPAPLAGARSNPPFSRLPPSFPVVSFPLSLRSATAVNPLASRADQHCGQDGGRHSGRRRLSANAARLFLPHAGKEVSPDLGAGCGLGQGPASCPAARVSGAVGAVPPGIGSARVGSFPPGVGASLSRGRRCRSSSRRRSHRTAALVRRARPCAVAPQLHGGRRFFGAHCNGAARLAARLAASFGGCGRRRRRPSNRARDGRVAREARDLLRKSFGGTPT